MGGTLVFKHSGRPEFDTNSRKWLICIGHHLEIATTTGTFGRRSWVF